MIQISVTGDTVKERSVLMHRILNALKRDEADESQGRLRIGLNAGDIPYVLRGDLEHFPGIVFLDFDLVPKAFKSLVRALETAGVKAFFYTAPSGPRVCDCKSCKRRDSCGFHVGKCIECGG